MPEQTKKDTSTDEKVEVVDITSGQLPKGVEVEIDPSEDAWAIGAPPPKGCYPFKVAFQTPPPKSWTKRHTRDGSLYYLAQLELRLALAGEYEGATAFMPISTMVRRGKHISTAAGLIAKCGFKLPAKLDDLSIARLANKLVAQGPTIVCDVDWEAYSASDEKNVLVGMEKFPELPDGGYDHAVQDSKGNDCFARLRIKKVYGKGDEHPPFGPSKPGEVQRESEEVLLTPTPKGSGKKAAPEPAPGEELELLE